MNRMPSRIFLVPLFLLFLCQSEARSQDLLNDNITFSGATLNLRTFATNIDGSNDSFARLISITSQPPATGNTDVFVTSQDGGVYTVTDSGGVGTSTLWFDYDDAVAQNRSNVSNGYTLDFATGGTAAHDGLRAIAFHPEFASNRKFYTSAMVDRPSNRSGQGSDFNYIGFSTSEFDSESVVAEWTLNADGDIDGNSYRELFRVRMPVFDHPVKQMLFNNFAQPGDADYGLLYIAHGDGSVQSATAGGGQVRNNALGKILRVNPLQSGSNPYTTPGNPFNNVTGTLNEIYALGFRNPHHLSFAKAADDSVHLIAAETGRDNIEEVDLIQAGGDYGWSQREGTFVHIQGNNSNGGGGGYINGVSDLPPDDYLNGYTYPSAQYDHDTDPGRGFVGSVIAGGFVIDQSGDPGVQGEYIFADFGGKSGYVYQATFTDLLAAKTTLDNSSEVPADLTQATISRLRLTLDGGRAVNDLKQLWNLNDRNDIRFGRGPNGEMFITSKQTNTLYLVTNSLFVVPDPVSEPFLTESGQYAAGSPLEGQGPTTVGMIGNWINGNNAVVSSTSLIYSNANYLGSTGGSVNISADAGNGRQGRLLSTPYNSSSNDTVYISFLMQTGTDNVGSYRAFELHDGGFDDSANRQFQLGFQNGDFSSGGTNYGFRISQTNVTNALDTNDGGVNLFVVKLELSDSSASDTVTVWQNPPIFGTDPSGGVTVGGQNITFDRVTFAKFGNSDGASWDELRIGTSFAEVTGGQVLLGDADGNGEINNSDIGPFALALFNPSIYAAMYPDLDPEIILDMNADTRFDNFDIPGFAAALGF